MVVIRDCRSMQINSKSLNIGIVGKGNYREDTFRPLIDKGLIGLCCGLFSHSFHDIIPLRSYGELEDAVDAVFILDPEYCTFNTISDLVRSMKHVFVSNCKYLTKREIRQLKSLAYEAGTQIQVSMPHRFHQPFHEIKEKELKPHIIECNHYHPRAKENKHISVIEDLLMPDIDVLINISNARIRSVFATGVGVMHNDPDVVNARIEFYNGCIATLSASKISDKKVHKIRFFENNNYHTLNYQDQSVRTVTAEEPQPDSSEHPEVTDETNFHEEVNESKILEKELESFYYCIELGTEPVSVLDDYLNARMVADEILDQLERNFRRK